MERLIRVFSVLPWSDPNFQFHRQESLVSLVLEIRDPAGAVVVAQNFPLEIVPISKMTGHKDLRPVAGGTGGDPSRAPESPPFTMTEGSDKILVWMHGYNVSPGQASATFAEVFKRFFHAGLMGKFYGVSWFGDPPAPGVPHYHQAVVNAFATAGAYKDFITTLAAGGQVHLAAHSLGNLVVGAAIHDRDKGLTAFNKYFAIDAAVALEAYGQTDPDQGMITVDDWLDYWNYEITDAQGTVSYPDQKLLASEWYKQFPDADNRSKLTWRDRLKEVVSTVNGPKVYNFFSSTEDVLRAYPDDDIVHLKELWRKYQDTKSATEVLNYLALSTFVKQEKFKGRRSFFNIADNIGGVSSSYCGWSFNNNWDVDTDQPDVKIRRTPAQAALIPETELPAKPFFDPPTFKLFGADLVELVSPAGSAFVDKSVKDDAGLNKYYTANNDAHDKVKIRDWLLAEAFPVTTLPMGANENGVISKGNNIDMSGVKTPDGGCCKTSEGAWPKTRNGEWWHSDYKNIAYQHVFAFYDNIINTIEKPNGVLP